MVKFTLIISCCLAIISSSYNIASGQMKHKKVKKDSITIPQIRAALGGFEGGELARTKAVPLLVNSLSAKDKEGKQYKVISFDFGYEKIDTFFNDSTEKLQLFKNYLSNSFQSDHLDTLWSHRIQGYLSKGEKLYFDQIIVEDTIKRIKYEAAPFSIKITQ